MFKVHFKFTIFSFIALKDKIASLSLKSITSSDCPFNTRLIVQYAEVVTGPASAPRSPTPPPPPTGPLIPFICSVCGGGNGSCFCSP
jgi:hypothetical protein